MWSEQRSIKVFNKTLTLVILSWGNSSWSQDLQKKDCNNFMILEAKFDENHQSYISTQCHHRRDHVIIIWKSFTFQMASFFDFRVLFYTKNEEFNCLQRTMSRTERLLFVKLTGGLQNASSTRVLHNMSGFLVLYNRSAPNLDYVNMHSNFVSFVYALCT